MPTPLSAKNEAKILDAVTALCDATSEIKSAADVHAATVKVAQDFKLTPGMIKLLCVGYNTAMTNEQRERNSDILQKHASFPLADYEAVIRDVFMPATEPTTKAASAIGVSEEYAAAPRNPNRRQQEAAYYKMASTISVKLENVQKKSSKLQEAEQLESDKALLRRLKVKVASAENDLLQTIGSLGRYFRQTLYDAVSPSEFKAAAESLYGTFGSHIVEKVFGTTKFASAWSKKPVDWSAAPYCFLKTAHKQALDINALDEQYNALEKKLANVGAGMLGAAAAGTLLQTAAGDHLSYNSRNSLVDRKLNDLTDPDHEEKLRQIRGQAMLGDFLTNDEVLSTHEPSKVMQAYNELNQLSTRAAQQPVVARAVLRKWMTQGGIEPFEAKELTDLEKSIAQTQNANRSTLITSPEKRSHVLGSSILR